MEKRVKWWRSGPPSKSPGERVLRNLYVDQNQSIREIAAHCGVTSSTVANWLRNAGISTRSGSEASKLAAPKRAWMYDSPEHKAMLRAQAAAMREAITPESRKKQGETRRRKKIVPHNKGQSWSPEERAKHMAYRKTPEYRAKLSAAARGSKSNLWKGGVSSEEERRMHGWEWRRRASECYARDKHICQDCGVLCVGGVLAREQPSRKIQAHHIIPRRHGGGDELSNLVTLCSRCHGKREAKGRDALFV